MTWSWATGSCRSQFVTPACGPTSSSRLPRTLGPTGVTSFAGPLVVNVSPRAITKTLAVAEEMAEASFPAEAVAVFGDMPNDLPLFAWSGWACAVANGHPTLLEAADEIIPTNDDDGVATTIQRLLEL